MGSKTPVKKVARCPVCRDPTEPDYQPFCSKRCADVDLGRWLTGGYAIPGREDDDEDGPDPDTSEPADDEPSNRRQD